MATVDLDLQVAVESATVPDPALIRQWTEAALSQLSEPRRVLTVRVMDRVEIQQLNQAYRGKDRPTNVLSFPFEYIPGVESDYLGDVAICHEVVVHEAEDQNKPVEAHFAHMVVHGILHLCGYDHIDDAEARDMEGLEVRILASLGYPDPYSS